MDGSTRGLPAAGHSRGRAAGVAGLLAPVAWAGAAGIEVARSNIGRSLISRPERFFSDATWHPAVVALVALYVALGLVAGLATVASAHAGRRLAGSAGVLLLVSGGARLAVAMLMPSDPSGYTVSAGAAMAANVAVLATPFAMLAMAVALRRESAVLAWAGAAAAVAMTAVGPWAMTWSAWSGASQPQLLALEPVEAISAGWFALAGARLIGLPEMLAARFPGVAGEPIRVPSPGRLATLVVSLAVVAAVGAAVVPFVGEFRPVVAAQFDGRSQVERIRADAVERTYRVYRPRSELAAPGLVIVLHGSFGGGFQAEAMTGFDAQADRLGWIVVYPDGVADGWDAFGSGPAWGRHPGADDVAFVRALIERFEAGDGVDADRVYVTGMSRGGMMTYRLGCELSGTLAAIAPVSGNMATAAGSVDVPCNLTRPVSVLAIHGTADATIPMAGGKVDIVFSPMADVIARWRSMDGCADSRATRIDGVATTIAWSCAGGASVTMRILAGGCHCWPTDAAAVIADFFVAHPRRPFGG
jgi:polyhydroxybutyrate depolymerase